MNIFLKSMAIGCTASLYEVAVYRKALEMKGHTVVNKVEDADVVVLNTCGFTADTENDSINTMNRIKNDFPDKKLVVGGCLPKINAKALKTSYQDLTFRPEKIDELLLAIGINDDPISEAEAKSICDETHNLEPADFHQLPFKFKIFYYSKAFYFNVGGKLKLRNHFMDNHFNSATINHTKFLIQTAKGCLGKCTYCSIKKSRGTLVSSPLEQIMQDINKAKEVGARELVLVGEDVGAWGQDIGSDISKLLKTVDDYIVDQRIIIPFFEPMWMIKYYKALKPIFDKGKIISLYIPFQSGSDRVLDKMGRFYSTRELTPLVRELKRNNPDMVTKTHLLHSFPSETWPEFFSSIKEGFVYDFVAAFPYSSRPGTHAAYFPDQIPPVTKALRTFIAGYIFLGWNIYKSISGSIKSKYREIESRLV
jgi:tRNA A37 methylthiotransferase MiaB